MTKSLDELKEMANKQFNMQMELMKELPSLPFAQAIEFENWYATHPLQKEILFRAKTASSNLNNIKNRLG